MTLDAKHRSSIYQKFVPLLGDEDANALMSEFPAIEADELVTKQFLRAEMAELRGEMAQLGTGLRAEMAELRGEMADLRTGLRGEMAQLGTGLRGEMADLRTGLRGEMVQLGTGLRGEMGITQAGLRGEMAQLRLDLERKINQQTLWLGGLVITCAGLVGVFG